MVEKSSLLKLEYKYEKVNINGIEIDYGKKYFGV